MPKDLTALINPKSVAVVGASRTPGKVGAVVLKNIVDSKFTGKIYPINPNTDNINGLQCFKDIMSLPEIPDLAVVATPGETILAVLEQLGQKGIKNAVVFAAGFKETGPEGAKLEKELTATALKYQINVLGPNCLGFVNNLCPVNATFAEPATQTGNLRFISQSGAIAASLFDWCKSTGLGYTEFVTLGNKSVLNENDVLQYFLDHSLKSITTIDTAGSSNMSPIGLYLESISNGPEFLRITKEISKNDPILIIKPGKTSAAAKAMQSHTGAIAGEDTVLTAVLEDAGVIRCQSLEDFFDYSRAFAWENLPLGPNVAIISNAGGPAVISADAVIEEGLQLSEFSGPTKEKLLQVLPRSASIINPVDVLGDALADRFAQAAEIILQSDQAQSLVVILTPQIMTQIEKTAEFIGNLSKKYNKPIFCSFIGGGLVAEGEKILNTFKIPSFRFPERAISAIGAMWRYKQKQLQARDAETLDKALPLSQIASTGISQIVANAIKKGSKSLDNLDSNEILSLVGIPTPQTQVAVSLEDAKTFANKYGWSVVLKLSSPGLLHKKLIGGVVCDIRDSEHLESAWDTLTRKISEMDKAMQPQVTIQIQKEIADGVEVIIGIKRDPTFGPFLLFGAGGSLAELISDRNLHLLPLNTLNVTNLVNKSKIYKVLQGKNGEPPFALDKLYDLILRLGKLADMMPEASDIEINPVIVTLNDVWAVDGKIIINGNNTGPVANSNGGSGDAANDALSTTEEAPAAVVPMVVDQPVPSINVGANSVGAVSSVKTTPTGPKFKVATALTHVNEASTYHYFDFQPEVPMTFQPGQYISVKVASDRINSYSIADRSGPDTFSLFVDIKPGGPGSKFFEALKVGDKITYLGPFGIFTFKPNDGAENLLFLGTGSGCSPLRCMIESLLIEQSYKKPIILYIGLNHVEDIFWTQYLEDMHAKYPNFSYKIAIWKPNETWKGHTGFITDIIKQDFPDASGCAAYMCGAKPMIDSATTLLKELKCPPERIYFEKF